MCLIIQREPKFEIPFEKFESAITVNPDGYGLAYPGEKGLVTLRSQEKPDPEKLYRLVNEELIDTKLMIHLRFTTVGKTILRNAHPFPVLEKAKDGVDLRMAHNGTLGKYRPTTGSSESDTRVFVKEFVRPLFKRFARGVEPEELLADPFLKKLLESQLTGSSVLAFLDSEGNSLLCNEEGNGGKKEEGWYYSNKYSFNSTHREPTPPKVNYYQPPAGVNYYLPPAGGYTKPKTTIAKFASSCTVKFSDKYGMSDISDATLFSDDTIRTICENPEDSQLLVKELIHAIH